MIPRVAAALAVALAAPAAAAGQLAERIAAQDGQVAVSFPTRPGVEVCENSVRTDGGRTSWGRTRRGWEETCVEGDAQIVLTVVDGRVREIELGPPGIARADRELGEVSGTDVAEFLLDLAETGPAGAARQGLLAASIADAGEIWPRLLEIGGDRELGSEIRQGALFHASRFAAEVVTRGLLDVANDQDDDEEVRVSAVFALSRRPEREGVPILMELARTAEGKAVRESALFWLARADDPRVIPFFEQILLGAASRR